MMFKKNSKAARISCENILVAFIICLCLIEVPNSKSVNLVGRLADLRS